MAIERYNRIKSVLADKGWTNKKLAEALNINAVTVSDWCTNQNQPSIPRLYEIARVLDVDVRDLLIPTK
jgi:putative transcriptional regulator